MMARYGSYTREESALRYQIRDYQSRAYRAKDIQQKEKHRQKVIELKAELKSKMEMRM